MEVIDPPSLEAWRAAPRWWVALSGGLDSTVLLHALAQQPGHPPLSVVHVDHGLHPQSGDWLAHCRKLAETAGADFHARRVEVTRAGDGLEAAARDARYRVFESLVGTAEVLFQAHHLDDQVETFFLRLLRGAGTEGLAGIPHERPLGAGRLARPLLGIPRAELLAYAQENGLAWVEDSSNSDPAMDRNYLRTRVLPLLAQRWPAYRGSVERSIRALEEANSDLAAIYRPLLRRAAGSAFGEATLDLAVMSDLPAHGLGRLLRLWLDDLGRQPPSRAKLDEFVRQLRESGEGASPRMVIGEWCLRVFRGRVHLCPPVEAGTQQEWQLSPGDTLRDPHIGTLRVEQACNGGLALPHAGHWQVRCRRGGERCRPAGRAHSQGLKHALQEHGVPPWLRPRLPLLYAGDSLVAVAGVFDCEAGLAPPGEPGWNVVWQPPGKPPAAPGRQTGEAFPD